MDHLGEQEELNTRVAVLETKNEAQECRLNSLEADVGKKFDRLEAKLDQVLEAARSRPSWLVALTISGLLTIATGLIIYLVTQANKEETMSFTIEQNFIPGLAQEAYDAGHYVGVVAHATANNGDSADGERDYESTTWQNAFVHFFVDDLKILQVADTNYLCYGAGHTANHMGYAQVELCQTTDPDQVCYGLCPVRLVTRKVAI